MFMTDWKTYVYLWDSRDEAHSIIDVKRKVAFLGFPHLPYFDNVPSNKEQYVEYWYLNERVFIKKNMLATPFFPVLFREINGQKVHVDPSLNNMMVEWHNAFETKTYVLHLPVNEELMYVKVIIMDDDVVEARLVVDNHDALYVPILKYFMSFVSSNGVQWLNRLYDAIKGLQKKGKWLDDVDRNAMNNCLLYGEMMDKNKEVRLQVSVPLSGDVIVVENCQKGEKSWEMIV